MPSSLIAPPDGALALLEPRPAPLRAIILPRPFSTERQVLEVPQGLRLSEILLEAGIVPSPWLRVWVDDWLIPREMWHVVRPRAGRLVTVRAVAGGGGGQGGEKSTGRIIAMVAIAILAAAVSIAIPVLAPGFAAAYPVLTAVISVTAASAVSIGGGLLVNALIPIQQPKLDAQSQPEPLSASPTYSLQGARNQMAVYRKVPQVLGWHRMTPPYAAEPVTTLDGADQYLSLVFCLGYGPVEIHRPRIGEEPLENFQGVTTEFRPGYVNDPPLTIYQNDTHEEPLSLPLVQPMHLIRTTQPGTQNISVDIVFPRGLFRFDPQTGDLLGHGVTVRVHIRPVGTVPWAEVAIEHFPGGAATRTSFRRTYTASFAAPGTYEVSVGRDVLPINDPNVVEDVFWTVLRSTRFVNPIAMKGVALYAMRIKATDQLQGVVDTFNIEVVSLMADWDGAAWVFRPATNPASIFRHVLQGPAGRTPIPDSRINLEALHAWADWCREKRYRYGAVIDYETTVQQLLTDVAAVGMAALTIDSNGRYSVVRDIPQPGPIQLLTPRNSWGFTGRRAFPDRPHGFRVRYIDGNGVETGGPGDPSADASWEIEEATVYAQGFDAATATRFESLEFRGVTAFHQAVGLAKYHHRVAELRPEIWEITCDVENLVCTRGDLVEVAHDVMHAGLGWGRIKALTFGGGGLATGFIADEEIVTEFGKTYQIRQRGPLGGLVTFAITATGTATQTVTYTAPQPPDTVGAAGDLFSYGETGSATITALVKGIDPGPDLTARLTLVPYNEAIYAFDSDEPFPPYDPHISRGGTRPPWQGAGPPAAPFIDLAYSDETTLVFGPGGSVQPFIVVAVRYIPQGGAPDQAPEFVNLEVQLSFWTLNSWMHVKTVPGSTQTIGIETVTAGNVYDIRIRTVAGHQASGWTLWQGVVVYGRTSRPPDVPVLTPSGRSIRWAYPNAPIDLGGFILRRHFGTRTVWEDAQPLHDGWLSSTVSMFPIDLYDQTATYLLKAVNTSGLESVNAVTLAVNLPSGVVFGDRLVVNLLDTIDLKALGFPGTVTNGTVIGGNLVTPSVALFWVGPDSSLFWEGADSDPFWNDEYLAMTYIFNVLPDADQVPCSITVLMHATALAVSLEFRTSGSDLFWAGADGDLFWGGADSDLFWDTAVSSGEGWVPWPGTIQALTRQVYEFRITTAAGPVGGVIDLLSVEIDVPDIRENFPSFAMAASTGTRLPITRSYRVIKLVSATLHNDAGNAVLVSIEDKGSGGPPLTLGPLLKAWDIVGMGGVAVAGVADVEIIGY